MKLIRRLSLCLLIPFCLATASRAETAISDYDKAVKAYVTAAGQEVQALKLQAEQSFKAVTESKKDAYQEFQAAFGKYQAAYEKLKQAAPKDFDPLKAQYEKQRQLALTAYATAQKP
jgi:hypothetical protein